MSRPRISAWTSSPERVRRADLELDLLGRLLADQQLVLALDVIHDRLVELVAADADRLRDDDPAERDHRDLAGAAADVDDHRAGRLADRKPGADRGRHRLLDQVGLPGARRRQASSTARFSTPVTPDGHADDHPRMRPAVLVDLLDEVPEHLLGDLEVGDHAVLQRPDRLDRARASARASAWPRSRPRAPPRCASRPRPRSARTARCRARGRTRACSRCPRSTAMSRPPKPVRYVKKPIGKQR